MAMILLLLPSFCTFSAFMSIALFCTGIAGSGGLATLLIGIDCVPSLNGRSLGFDLFCLLLCAFCGNGVNNGPGLSSFSGFRCRFSIWPSTVVPLKAKSSSGIRQNLMTPRAGATPNESARNVCKSAALRLLVVGSNWDGSALTVSI